MYGENIVAPPGNQAANRENKYSPVIRGPRSTRLSYFHVKILKIFVFKLILGRFSLVTDEILYAWRHNRGGCPSCS